jgi:hypothetical protein
MLLAGAAVPLYGRDEGNLLLLTAENRKRIIAELAANKTASAQLRKLVEAALKAGPWSVTNHRPKNPGNAKLNDYYTEAPYWWPDPKNPSGPYIRKDGERNPERTSENRRDIGELCECLLTLGMGAGFLSDPRCSERAAKVISVWFIDPKTRMNPHLEFGQAVIGKNDGRGAGMIETVSLIDAAQGIALLEQSGKFDKDVSAGVRRWFADYLRWMTTSSKGLDEKNAGNNHATWWTAQVAAFATLLRDREIQAMAWTRYRTHLIPKQVKPDGSCPAEEARTKSLSYSTMNLDGYSILCRLAQLNGTDLWHWRAPSGVNLEKSFYYLKPYVLQPKSWSKQQITPFEPDRTRTIFLGLAGLGLHSQELLSAYRQLPRAEHPRTILIDLIVKTEYS